MKNVDYIIVGCGLASIAFCEQLRAYHKSFIVFDDNSQKSSLVAVGMYNPVILKRFSEVWKAKEQLHVAIPMYRKIEKDFNVKIDYKLQLLRRFASVNEQNMWFNAADKPKLEPYLSTKLIKNTNAHIDAPFDFGEVLHAGRIDTEVLIVTYKEALRESDNLNETKFQYETIEIKDDLITYKDLEAKQIVFAEGFGVKKNPYFNSIPLNGTKGEVLTIKAPKLKMDFAVKSSVFVIPIGNDCYKVGSTYNWDDKSDKTTEEAKVELLSKVKTFIKCNFEVVDHVAGIRPTIKDRRPIIGRHPKYSNLYILNGLGTRGVMIAPYVAKKLYNFIENDEPLDSEINVDRF